MASYIRSTPQYRANGGFTLIEIMVALLVLSVGLLGLALLQATGMKFNSDSYMRSQATILAYDLIDRMRANRVAADAGNYCITSVTPCTTTAPPSTSDDCDAAAGCDSSQKVAVYDIKQWYAQQKSFLSEAASLSSLARTTATTASGKSIYQYTITMRWKEREADIEQTWVVEL